MSLVLPGLILPFVLQIVASFFDEFYFHHKRGLGLWEKLGHPLDTITVLVCYIFVITSTASPTNIGIYICLAVFSCLFITKDEFVHHEKSGAEEQWLHSVLFILHPITLIIIPLYWIDPNQFGFISLSEHNTLQTFIEIQLVMICLYLSYQVFYWNISWRQLFQKQKVEVDNDYYHHLGDDWFTATDDPVALLRAESKLKNPWVAKTISKQLGSDKKKILDIGCGAGFLSNALASEGHDVDGIDMSEESLAVARKYDTTKTANYQFANAYELPFADQSFDVVCAMDFLEHVEDPNKVIQEASRVLKPGGIFFFHTFSKNFLAYIVIIKLVEWFLPKTPKHMHILRLFISPKPLKKMITAAEMKTEHLMGIRPQIGKSAFWMSMLKREVHPEFSFTFTKSTLLSYIGFARKL